MSAFLGNSNLVPILLIAIGVIGLLAIYILHRKRNSPAPTPKSPRLSPSESAVPKAPAPHFALLQKQSGMGMDALRAGLIALGIVVALGLLLLLLPQRAVDRMVQDLQSRRGVSQPEKIALLYLGDEVGGEEFRIRAVVKNIDARPIEQLDAAVRLYAQDGTLLQTVIARLDKSILAPEEIARLDLIIPKYPMQFSGYAVEFKLRQGDSLSYKDMRAPQSRQGWRP